MKSINLDRQNDLVKVGKKLEMNLHRDLDESLSSNRAVAGA